MVGCNMTTYIDKLVLATSNNGKIKDIIDIFDYKEEKKPLIIVPKTHCDIEENGETYEQNAIIKAHYFVDKLRLPCLADDSGIEVSALNNEPGIHSARYYNTDGFVTDELNMKKVIENLADKKDKSAVQICSLCLMIPGNGTYDCITARGIISGEITTKIRGSNGFGYDSCFVPNYNDFNKTKAEMSKDERLQFSHRLKAFSSLVRKMAIQGLYFFSSSPSVGG